jgi:hypothetical protein
MPRRITLSILAIAVLTTTTHAADLPAQSKLGAIFAEPAPARVEAVRSREYSGPVIPYSLLPDPVWNRGYSYYGSSWSYYDGGAYYGGAGSTPSFIRLPYVCGLYGYCQ